MTRRALPAAALMALALLIAPEPTRADHLTGWASAYAPGVFQEVVAFRLENQLWPQIPPSEWIYAEGYIAVADCRSVGEMATLVDPSGREWRVLIADCGERNKPGEGQDWMIANNIAAELDWEMWEQLTTTHGRPLWIEVVR
jgi:hypothetical protein